jgi:hypothetical protein
MEVLYMDLRKFDKRIIHRNVDKGIVTPKEYQKYLGELKDLEAECEVFEVQLPGQKDARGDEATDKPAVSGNGRDGSDGENEGA